MEKHQTYLDRLVQPKPDNQINEGRDVNISKNGRRQRRRLTSKVDSRPVRKPQSGRCRPLRKPQSGINV